MTVKRLLPKDWRRFSFSTFKEAVTTFRPALRGERSGILKAFSLTFAGSLLELLQPWPLKVILDDVLGGGSDLMSGLQKPVQAGIAAAAFLLIVGLGGVLTLKAAVASAHVSKNVTIRIRRQVFTHLHRLAFPFHQSNKTGDLLQRLMGDVDGVRSLIFASWVPLIERTVFFLGIAAVIAFAVDYKYALLALAPLPVYAVLIGRGNRKLKKLVRKQRRSQSTFTSMANESLQQIRIVKAYAAEDAAAEVFAAKAASGEGEEAEAAKLSAKITMVSDVCRAFGIALVLFVGAIQVLNGRLTPGSLVLVATYVRSMYRPLAKLSQQGARLAVSTVSAERLMDILRIPAEDPTLGAPAPPFAGDIKFEGVAYEHDDGVEALKGLSFHIEPGRLALVAGPNGCGKSTTIAVLLRLLTPQSGRVLIDDEPVDQYAIDSYRRSFAYVPQDIQLFGASIRENILYGRPDASEQEVIHAAKQALFDEVVARKPEGYGTQLGEGGDTLSGGEARRLMLARAAIRQAAILLLDEPLTGLDAEARAIIARAIKGISRGRTTLVVSHGPSDELKPDVVIRMEAGKKAFSSDLAPVPAPMPEGENDAAGRRKRSQVAAPWWKMGDLARISSPDSVRDFLVEAGLSIQQVKLDSLRLWPERALASLEIGGRVSDGAYVSTRAFVKSWADPQRAARAVKRARTQPLATPFGSGVRLLPGGHSALFVFPYDPALPELAFLMSKDEVLSILEGLSTIADGRWKIDFDRSTYEPLKYRPERRLVAKADLLLTDGRAKERALPVFLRYFPDARGAGIARLSRTLKEAGFHSIPDPLGVACDGRLFVEERLKGIELLDKVVQSDADPARLAERLHALQKTDAGPVPAVPADFLWTATQTALRFLMQLDHELAPAVRGLTQVLHPMMPDHQVKVRIHGDLHLQQILVQGDDFYFVDFERTGVGDPLQDVGSLVAHLLAEATIDRQNETMADFAAAFVRHYRQGAGVPARRRSDLAFFTACSLVLRAEAASRALEPNWHGKVIRLVRLAEEIARGPWIPEEMGGGFPRNVSEVVPIIGSSNRGPGRPLAQDFFERAEKATGTECSWEIFYTHARGPWTGLLKRADGERLYVRYDPQTEMVEQVFPEDDVDLAPLRGWLSRGELLGYRASRKATLRVQKNGNAEYVRIMTSKKYQTLRSKLEAVNTLSAAHEQFPRLAPVVHCQQQVIVTGSVSGKMLRQILADEPTASHQALRQVGDALARFHQVPAGENLPRAGPSAFDVSQVAETVGKFFPDQALLFGRTLLGLADVSDEPTPDGRLVHGDLHDGNIFVDSAGVSLIDFEYVAKGKPVKDVGNLCAELVVDTFKRGQDASVALSLMGEFLDAYRSSGGEIYDKELYVSGSYTLYRLACLYIFRKQWQHLAPLLLEQAVNWSKASRGGGAGRLL